MSLLAALFGRKPHPLLADTAAFFKEFSQDAPLEEYEFVVFDTELTGLDERRDEIVSIGAVRIRNLQILAADAFSIHIKPSRPLPKDSTLIHRITPQQLENAPCLAEALPDFIKYCDRALLVGYCLDIDTAFLNRACGQLYGATVSNPCVDTLRLSNLYFHLCGHLYRGRGHDEPPHTLAGLGKMYGLPEFTPHDALQDALQTAYLFLFLIRKLRQEGYHSLRQIFQAGQGARWGL
ncbi:MAG: PolC-type DNA polymerase III [Thermodesulfobacteriota bacterium]